MTDFKSLFDLNSLVLMQCPSDNEWVYFSFKVTPYQICTILNYIVFVIYPIDHRQLSLQSAFCVHSVDTQFVLSDPVKQFIPFLILG